MRLVLLGAHETLNIERLVGDVLQELLPFFEEQGVRTNVAIDLIFWPTKRESEHVLIVQGYDVSFDIQNPQLQSVPVRFGDASLYCGMSEGVSSETLVNLICTKLVQHVTGLLRRRVYRGNACKVGNVKWTVRISW